MKRILTLLSTLVVLQLAPGLATAQETYRIKPGDVLRIEVLEDSSINRDTLVLPDGRVSVPLAGTVAAGGRTLGQVRSSIVSELAPNFASEPTVFVSLARLAREDPQFPMPEPEEPTIEIYVLGQVNTPGKVAVAPGTTMLQALAQIGGFSQFAARKRIQLRRVDSTGRERVYRVNYNEILAGRSNIGMTVMAPGDVIIVPERRLFE
ncbi:polysaccharide biosynthesis/export family protein [Roseovarius aestuariivivens]|uniref:polysaccharide biosynthesis/export family protein n=1 Tax=Roseovarius aestuariivivens TaxID=1888910 RepID=UPI001080B4AC|nr:polysaccharide biosynthesis/export family protein [Roseovarius aestuariivivens]